MKIRFRYLSKYIQNEASSSGGGTELPPFEENEGFKSVMHSQNYIQNEASSSDGGTELRIIEADEGYNHNTYYHSQRMRNHPLLYDGDEPFNHVCYKISAFLYYHKLANSFIPCETVPLPEEYCNKSDNKEACLESLKYFGFTADNEADIIRYAYFDIVTLDIMSNLPFRKHKEKAAKPYYAYQYLRKIAKEVIVSRGYVEIPHWFCQRIKSHFLQYYF